MEKKQIFDDLQAKINKILEESPAKDIEKNVKALLMQGIAKLDLVTREEFDAQALMLEKMREQLGAMVERIASLEKQLGESQPASEQE